MSKHHRELLAAVDNKDLKAVTAALEAGADINTKNKYGRAPIHLAIRRKSKTIIRKLLKAGADLTLTDDKGQLPFTLLVQDVRDVKLAAELVAAGAWPAARAGGCSTPRRWRPSPWWACAPTASPFSSPASSPA